MKCPKCGKEIANDSVFCEYCGVLVEKGGNRVRWRQLFLGFIILVVVVFILFNLGFGIGLGETLLIVVLLTVIIIIFSIKNGGGSSN